MKKYTTFGFTALVGVFLLYALWSRHPTIDEDDHHHHHHHHHHDDFLHFSQELADTHGIEIETAAAGVLKHYVKAPAEITIAPDRLVHIVPKVSGVVVKAHKNLGEQVAANEVLVLLESKEIAEAKAAYLTALKRFELTQSVLDRETTLHQKQIVSTEDLHNATNRSGEAEIELELARQKLHNLGLSYKKIAHLPEDPKQEMQRYEVRSPIAGQVIAREVTPGEFISSDAEVYAIADLSVVFAEVSISAHDRPFVAPHQFVTIRDGRGNMTEGEVTYLSPIIDPTTRRSTAIVVINNEDEAWLPGTFVQAEFLSELTDIALHVPKTAIQMMDGDPVIFVVKDDGFAVHPVTLGRSDDTCCEILSGIDPGVQYASTNTFLLKADLKKEEAEHEH